MRRKRRNSMRRRKSEKQKEGSDPALALPSSSYSNSYSSSQS
jgi:hypothetical protein